MSDEALPIANCPNPECGKSCNVQVLGWKNCKYFVRCGLIEEDKNIIIIGCGYGGPIVDTREEAIRLHNLKSPRPQMGGGNNERMDRR